MPMNNVNIAKKFSKIADLLEIKGANTFRVRAYRNAARTIKEYSKNISKMVKNDKDLTKLSGIGDDLASQIKEIVKTGSSEQLQELEKEMPENIDKLLRIQGLGPKKVQKMYQELGVEDMQGLKQALENNEVSDIEGFGEKTRENILEEIERVEQSEKRIKISVADEIASSLLDYIKELGDIEDAIVAGSFRRKEQTVGDLDILVTCSNSEKVMDHFTSYNEVEKVVSKGETKSTVLLEFGLQVDLRVVDKKSYGSALMYFTGSKEHNVEIRSIAQNKDLKINEYGVFDKDDKRVAGKTEKQIYKKLGLSYVEPELRENRGEIEKAKNNDLPKLITLDDIKGDLHVHTDETDGNDPIDKMIEAAIDKGYEYVAFTDHTKNNTVAQGMDEDRLREQMKLIDEMNDKYGKIKILKGAEVDILKDGNLDLSDDVLSELDLVICAVHSYMDLSEKEQTGRVIKAIENKNFHIFAHPTGRLINERGAYDINLEEVINAAKDYGCFIELNSHPDRLDLDDTYCKLAKEKNVKIALGTDAHSTSNLDFMKYGINQARRGWLSKNDVLNTLSLKTLLKKFNRS